MENKIIKSCFNCKHLHRWNTSATQYEPADNGWECNHPSIGQLPDPGDITPDPECKHCGGHGYYYDAETRIPYTGEVAGNEVGILPCQCWDVSDIALTQFYARGCPGYQYFDWEEYDYNQAEAEAKIEKQLSNIDPFDELDKMKELSNTLKLIEIGLLNSNGEPTNEFYRLSQQQYEAGF